MKGQKFFQVFIKTPSLDPDLAKLRFAYRFSKMPGCLDPDPEPVNLYTDH